MLLKKIFFSLIGALLLKEALLPLKNIPFFVETSVIGYPIFAKTHIYNLFFDGYLDCLIIPLLFSIFLFILERKNPLSPHKLNSIHEIFSLKEYLPSFSFLNYLASFFLILILSFGFAPWVPIPAPFSLWVLSIPFFSLFLIRLLNSFLKNIPHFHFYLNMTLCPLLLGLLLFISSFFSFTINGQKNPAPFLNYKYQILFIVLFLFYLFRKLLKVKSPKDTYSLLYHLILFYIFPFFLYYINFSIQGSTTIGDIFHSGEKLASALLISKGAFPWKDILFIHGLLEDPFFTLLGFKLFGTHLGALTYVSCLFLEPFYKIFLFLFYAYFLRFNFYFVLSVFLLFTLKSEWISPLIYSRFIFIPFIGIFFLKWLEKDQLKDLFFTIGLGLINFILVPETLFLNFSILLVFGFREFFQFKRRRPFILAFAFFGTCFSLFLIYLLTQDAFFAYFNYFKIFASDHKLAGGIPFTLSENDHFYRKLLYFSMYTSFMLLSFKCIFKIRFKPLDWLWLTWLIFTLFYLQKFLARADGHLYSVLSVSLVLLILILLQFLQGLENFLRSQFTLFKVNSYLKRIKIPIPFLFLLLITIPFISNSFLEKISSLPSRLSSSGQSDFLEKDSLLRYSNVSLEYKNIFSDFSLFFKSYSSHFFDFTNSPSLFHFYLNLPLTSPFFHVSMAIGEYPQSILIKDLQKTKPDIVAYYGSLGLWIWDEISNMVRHNDVSHYLLYHYKPFAMINNYLFMIRKDLNYESPSHQNLHFITPLNESTSSFKIPECKWGYTGYFFKRKKNLKTLKELEVLPVKIHDHLYEIPTSDSILFSNFTHLKFIFNTEEENQISIFSSLESASLNPAPIQFKTSEGYSNEYEIQVASCYQWHYDFTQNKLFVKSEKPLHLKSLIFIQKELPF